MGDVTGLVERAAKAIEDQSRQEQNSVGGWRFYKPHASAALLAALDPEDEALVMVMADAIEDSTGGASGSYSAAKAALAALKALAQGGSDGNG